ncbi:hypothetical protein D1B31_02415 [Neobacillus notoginsengisoli]|uniref:Uncharacterized protein n=1 Tax=Neobacillus notoginsengisoli TaxID=1578198 RepID=A0A417Z034_9BACI|nr:hypothetical protein [Neobacillus notoginsengisoli]RHW43529.1 hypothetical protein D1B31_02415 [Neobacillus notoginsengisoli]
MTVMTTITFANNQKELDQKIEQITQNHERLHPDCNVELSFLDPKYSDIQFSPHQTTQLIIGITISEKENQ